MSTGQEIWDNIQSIVNKSTDEYRVRMDSNIHCMDVGIAALKASDPNIDYSTKEKLHRVLRKFFLGYTSLEEAILYVRDKENIDRTVFVEDPKWGDYILGPSYATIQRRVSNALKSSKLDTEFTGTDESGKTTTNIGHLSLKGSEAATTPLEVKLRTMLSALENAPVASTLVAKKLKELHNTHVADASYVFNRKSFDLNTFTGILGEGTVLVTLQSSVKNNALAKVEAKIERELRNYLSSEKFKKQLLRAKGSNSVIEDIEEYFTAIISGKKLGPGTKHGPHTPKTSKQKLITQGTVEASKPARLRDVNTGKFTSLTNLQDLINLHLQDVISANMGDGTRKDILNYRTGRFAASARVERLTLSKEGMISAFYSYMRYPYGTFEPGGAQGLPRTRDPKLLISKSIKEIAAEMVSNRLRAVVV